jgi:hypothetical protein
VAVEIFNAEPTPKAFGAALPIELPTLVEFQFGLAVEIFNAEPTPKAFGAALRIELPTLRRSITF